MPSVEPKRQTRRKPNHRCKAHGGRFLAAHGRARPRRPMLAVRYAGLGTESPNTSITFLLAARATKPTIAAPESPYVRGRILEPAGWQNWRIDVGALPRHRLQLGGTHAATLQPGAGRLSAFPGIDACRPLPDARLGSRSCRFPPARIPRSPSASGTIARVSQATAATAIRCPSTAANRLSRRLSQVARDCPVDRQSGSAPPCSLPFVEHSHR